MSQRQYQGSAASGTLLREVLTEFTSDGHIPNTAKPWNTRQVRTRTVFKDDGDRWKETRFSDFDGFGNWRTVIRDGSSTYVGLAKTVTTDYNASRGTLHTIPTSNSMAANNSWTMPGANARWLWTTYGNQTVSEGTQSYKRQACFDSQSGLLLRSRALEGSAPGSQDVLREVIRSTTSATKGFVLSEKIWGGDDQASLDNSYSNLCQADLSSGGTPEYQLEHTYQEGALSRSVYVEPSNSSIEVLQVARQDIDANTGLPSSTYDTSDLGTSHSYDLLGSPQVVDAGQRGDHALPIRPTDRDRRCHGARLDLCREHPVQRLVVALHRVPHLRWAGASDPPHQEPATERRIDRDPRLLVQRLGLADFGEHLGRWSLDHLQWPRPLRPTRHHRPSRCPHAPDPFRVQGGPVDAPAKHHRDRVR